MALCSLQRSPSLAPRVTSPLQNNFQIPLVDTPDSFQRNLQLRYRVGPYLVPIFTLQLPFPQLHLSSYLRQRSCFAFFVVVVDNYADECRSLIWPSIEQDYASRPQSEKTDPSLKEKVVRIEGRRARGAHDIAVVQEFFSSSTASVISTIHCICIRPFRDSITDHRYPVERGEE